MKIRFAVDWLVTRLWVVIIVTVLLLAVYVELGRQALLLIPDYREEVESFLSQKLETPVSIGEISGNWDLFSPTLIVKRMSVKEGVGKGLVGKGITVEGDDDSFAPVLPELDAVLIEVDVLGTLANLEPRFGRIHIDGLRVGIDRNEEGKLSVSGLTVFNKTKKKAQFIAKKTDTSVGHRIDMLLEQRNIVFTNLYLQYREKGRNVTVLAEELRIGKRAESYELKALVNVQRESNVRLEMTAVFEGKPNHLETLRGKAYLNILEGNFASWLPQESYLGARVGNVDLSTELWADFSEGKLTGLLGTVEAKNVTGMSAANQPLKPVDRVSAQFTWNRSIQHSETAEGANEGYIASKANKWRLLVHRLDLDYGEEHWRNRKVVIATHRRVSQDKITQNIVDVQASEISIAPIIEMLMSTTLLSEEQRELVAALAPKGILKNTTIQFSLLEKEMTRFNIKSEFDHLQLTARGKIPGFDNISGYVDTDLDGGVLELKSTDPVVNLADIIRAPVAGLYLNGPVRWRKNAEGIYIDTGFIRAQTEDVRAEAMASLQLYKDKSPPFLQLHAGLFEGDGAQVSKYLPAKKLNANLIKWLDEGIESGDIVQGDILYNGPVKIDPHFQTRRTIQLRFQVEQTMVDYVPGWPKITDGIADIMQRGKETEVEVFDGRVSGAHVGPLSIRIPFFTAEEVPRLLITGDANGDLVHGLQFLKESPLEDSLSGFINDAFAKGDMKLKLDLGFSLGTPEDGIEIPMQTDVEINVLNGDLQIVSADLAVSDIEGQLKYSADKGLNATRMKGRLFNRNVIASIDSNVTQGEFKKMQVTVDGKVSLSDLNAWAKQPILNTMSGVTRYQSVLHFWGEGQGKRNTIDVRSSLKGVTVDMPPPFYKNANFPTWTTYSMTLDGSAAESSEIKIQYGEDVNMVLGLDAYGVERGKMSFSPNKAKMPNQPGIWVDGHVEYLNFEEWNDFFSRLTKDYFDINALDTEEELGNSIGQDLRDRADSDPGRGRTILSSFKMADLHVDVLEGFGQTLDDVNGQVMNLGDTWLVALQNKTLSSVFRVPSVYLELEDYDQLAQARSLPEEKIDVDFIYLRLPAEDEQQQRQWAGPLTNNHNEGGIDPLDFPPLKIRVRELMQGDDDWGSWRGQATLTDQGLLFENASADFKNITLKGDVLWEKKGSTSQTEFIGVATTNDVAKMTASFGYEPLIESQKGQLNIAIHWQGAPTDFDLSNCTGDMALAVKDGQLLSVDNAASSVRVIGLLNFQTLGRRLKLDFGDLYKKGLAFDTFGGDLAIDGGVVKTENFSLGGPSTQMKMKGSIDINKEQVYQEVEVTLPVGRNLVLPAAVVGGLPLAATLYVVDKALGDQLDKLTTLQFQIEGDWNDPKVTEVKFFK